MGTNKTGVFPHEDQIYASCVLSVNGPTTCYWSAEDSKAIISSKEYSSLIEAKKQKNAELAWVYTSELEAKMPGVMKVPCGHALLISGRDHSGGGIIHRAPKNAGEFSDRIFMNVNYY